MRISDWSSDVCSSDDKETVLADFTRAGERIVMLRGGDGGRGNASYKSSTNRAPRQHGVGWPGQEMYVWLRLKLLADAGLVRSEEHTSELQSLMRISYAVFCLKKKITNTNTK